MERARARFAASLAGLLAISVGASVAAARELTLDDRVASQKAIEQVYWNHRAWPADNPGPKPPLSEVMPEAAIGARVEDYLLKSIALETLLGRPITPAQLQAELDRMAADSRDPMLLRELFDALGNDPHVIAETLVRQTLADNLVRAARGAAGFEAWWSSTKPTLRSAIRERVATYTLPEIGVSSASRPAPQPLTATAPAARSGQTTVWTGTAMLVWGGEPLTNTGGLYDPPTDSWTATSTGAGVPDARSRHTAVWTGVEMIVWGGLTGGGDTNTGGRYVPATDSWTATSTGANCPSAREWHAAVWTGTRMIVWGGATGSTYLNTGGSYDPAGDSWTATGTGTGVASNRARHTAVWTGSQMIVWGGTDSVGRLNTGSRYTPGTDAWVAMTTTAAPVARYRHSVVWTGSQMIVWGGFGTTYLNTGGRYNPTLNTWSATAGGGPAVRADHSAVWTGAEMIVWGGQGPTSMLDNGGRYNFAGNTWILIASGSGSPAARALHSAVWSGLQMIVWGGSSGASALDTGGAYSPSDASWTPVAGAAPAVRFQPRAWAGYLGGAASFTVVAGGNAPLTYRWRKDGAPLNDGPGVGGAATDTLTRTALDAGDAGAYSVVVTNGTSSATSNDAALTVGSPRGGDVDPAFDRSAMFNQGATVVVAQADGKVLVGGNFTASHGAARGGLTRLNADGSTDRTFMNGMAGANGAVGVIVVQPDGRILIGGSFTTVHGVKRKRIARLNADGSLDTTFQNGMEGAGGTVSSVALQPDGKVLIGGAFNVINGENFFLDSHNGIARLNADGSTDTSFIHGTNTGLDQFCQGCPGAAAIVVQPDGKILIGGRFADVNTVPRIGLARLNADGTYDTTFLNGMSGPDLDAGSIALQPDGRILIAGRFSSVNGVVTGGFARLNSDGSLDGSFTHVGNPEAYDRTPIVLQPDGKILIWGAVTPGGASTVVRVNADGSVDGSFPASFAALDRAQGLSLRNDGKVLVGAQSIVTTGGAPRRQVVRLNADGSLDPSFDNARAGFNGAVLSVAMQLDAKAIVGGQFSEVDGVARGGIARLNPDGTLDASFQNGMAGVDLEVDAVAVQPDGRVLVAGWYATINGVARSNVARLNPDGSLDPTFQAVDFGPTFSAVRAMALEPDGRVLIGGDFTQVNGAPRGRVARLLADGSLDSSFMDGLTGANAIVTMIARTPGGQVYIGGRFGSVNGTSRKYGARLNADGSLDGGFALLRPFVAALHAFALQPDGRLITAQETWSTPGDGYADVIERLNPDGSSDGTFATSFVGPYEQYTPSYPVNRMVVQPDGRVLLGGFFPSAAGTTRGNLARVNADGTLDTSFEDAMAGIDGTVSDLALLPDGRVLAAGAHGGANGVASNGVVRLYGSAPVAPAISTQPAAQQSYEGSCAVFHVAATGTPLDYQWRKNGVPLDDGPAVSGAHVATLTLTGVSAGDAGDYDCVVTNVLGQATTIPVSLTVSAVPACKIAICDPALGSVLVDAPAPAEVASVQINGKVNSTLSWIDLGGGALYDVASSTLSDLRSGGVAGATCLANDVPGSSYADTQPDPASGEAYYYIVRGQTTCGDGGYGTDSSGVPRVPAAACP